MQRPSNLLLFTSHTRFVPRSSFSYNPLRAVYQQEDWYGYQEFVQRGETAAWRVESASVIVRERRDRIDLTRRVIPSAARISGVAQPAPSEAEGAPPRDDTGCRIATLPGHALFSVEIRRGCILAGERPNNPNKGGTPP